MRKMRLCLSFASVVRMFTIQIIYRVQNFMQCTSKMAILHAVAQCASDMH